MQSSRVVSTPQSRTSVCWINNPNSFSTGYTAQLFNYCKTIKSSRAIQQPRRMASCYTIRKPWLRSVQVQLKLHKEYFISRFEVMLSSCILFLTNSPKRFTKNIIHICGLQNLPGVGLPAMGGAVGEGEHSCMFAAWAASLKQANECPVDTSTTL